jgi:hypothetical protein
LPGQWTPHSHYQPSDGRSAVVHSIPGYDERKLAKNPVHPKRHFIRQGQRLPRDVQDNDLERLFAVIESPRDRAIFLLTLIAGEESWYYAAPRRPAIIFIPFFSPFKAVKISFKLTDLPALLITSSHRKNQISK